jgi:hypothetical protein
VLKVSVDGKSQELHFAETTLIADVQSIIAIGKKTRRDLLDLYIGSTQLHSSRAVGDCDYNREANDIVQVRFVFDNEVELVIAIEDLPKRPKTYDFLVGMLISREDILVSARRTAERSECGASFQ